MSVKGQHKPKGVFRAFPMTILLCLLGLLYIGNVHRAERNMRSIQTLEKELRTLKWEYNSAHADLMYESTESSVARVVRSMELEVAHDKPMVITDEP